MKILVVEHEWLVRELLIVELQSARFEVLEAETGAEAMARFEEHDPDVLMTDIRLPGTIDGWDIAERCRASKPDLPVIYTTAYSDQARMVPGAVLFNKPYRTCQIVSAIEKLAQGGNFASIKNPRVSPPEARVNGSERVGPQVRNIRLSGGSPGSEYFAGVP